jgi:hypothetical protein
VYYDVSLVLPVARWQAWSASALHAPRMVWADGSFIVEGGVGTVSRRPFPFRNGLNHFGVLDGREVLPTPRTPAVMIIEESPASLASSGAFP